MSSPFCQAKLKKAKDPGSKNKTSYENNVHQNKIFIFQMLFRCIYIMPRQSGLIFSLFDAMINIPACFTMKTFHFRFESGEFVLQLDSELVTFQQNVQCLNH